MDQNRVVIIVASYNHEQFISDCLESIIGQTYKNIQLIVIDDHSADRSWEIIQSYESRLRNRLKEVRLIHNDKNCGLVKNLNRALNLCSGGYIKFLSGDDFIEKNYTAYCVKKFESHSDIDVMVTNAYIVAENSTYDDPDRAGFVYSNPPMFNHSDFVQDLYRNNYICAPAVMSRYALYQECGTYDADIPFEDYDMFLRFAVKGKRFGYIHKPLVNYRKNVNSMMSLSNDPKLEKRRMIMYEGTKKVLYKYRKQVKEDIAAARMLSVIVSERCLAYEYHMEELKKIVDADFKKFKGWRKLEPAVFLKYKMKNLCCMVVPFRKAMYWLIRRQEQIVEKRRHGYSSAQDFVIQYREKNMPVLTGQKKIGRG